MIQRYLAQMEIERKYNTETYWKTGTVGRSKFDDKDRLSFSK